MNTLTKNRILQVGDEYRDKDGAWKPVPPKDFGMQIMFTIYKEVRRPAEKPLTEHHAKVVEHNSETISPDSRDSTKADPVAKAESDTKTPVPSHSGTGDTLPTVISPKAHLERAKAVSIVSSRKSEEISIPYTDLSAIPNWIGRNGTFKATAIRLRSAPNGIIQIRPEGKRGLAKNALIEFPATEIPQIINWLKEHQP